MKYADPSEFNSLNDLFTIGHLSDEPLLLTDSDKHYIVVQSEVGYTKLLGRLASLDIELQDTVLVHIGEIIEAEGGISPSTEDIAETIGIPSQLLIKIAECLEDRYGELFKGDPIGGYLPLEQEGWDLYRKLKESNTKDLDSISPF